MLLCFDSPDGAAQRGTVSCSIDFVAGPDTMQAHHHQGRDQCRHSGGGKQRTVGPLHRDQLTPMTGPITEPMRPMPSAQPMPVERSVVG